MALAYETVSLAEQTSHPFSLGAAYLTTAANLARCGEWQASEREASKALTIAEEYALGDMGRHSTVTHALVLAFQEPTEAALVRAKQAIDAMTARGLRALKTGSLASMGRLFLIAGRSAEGLAVIAEALALVERTGERVVEAELRQGRVAVERFREQCTDGSGTLLSQGPRDRTAAKCQNVGTTRRHQPRALVATARQTPGRAAHAGGNLRLVYEGFNTADLQDARGLLDELSSEHR